MAGTRPAAVAGTFYPRDPHALAAEIDHCFAGAAARRDPSEPAGAATWPKALIVPHAGYVYSGPIAATAYALLAPARDIVRRVVLMGPAHRVAVRGLALPAARRFETPLGTLDVDDEAIAGLADLPYVVQSDAVHALEHSLEVQLPFLQRVLRDFTLVPFAVGHASAEQVAEVLDRLWGGRETLILVSSDLSHYHPYGSAKAIDGDTAKAVLAMQPSLDHEQACGATPINGLLQSAARHGLHVSLLDLRNSGDTAGDRARVVGYASFAFEAENGHA